MAKHTLKCCGIYTARFLKYVWPFFNILNERINPFVSNAFFPYPLKTSENLIVV